MKAWHQMLMVVLFLIASKQKQVRHPSTDRWLSKLVYPYHGILLKNKKMVFKGQLSDQEHWFFFQRVWDQFPALSWELTSVNSNLKSLMPSSGLQGHCMHMMQRYRLRQTFTHIKI